MQYSEKEGIPVGEREPGRILEMAILKLNLKKRALLLSLNSLESPLDIRLI